MKDAPLILRIELLDLARSVWREVRVPPHISLLDLHDIIQMVMPWSEEHMHGFFVPSGKHFVSLPESNFGEFADVEEEEDMEEATLLREHLQRKGAKIRYVYDFGDSWTHEITLVGYGKKGDSPTGRHCLAGEGGAPLEDCGGAPGDEAVCDFVAARNAGRHKKNDPLKDWVPEDYDPTFFDLDGVNKGLDWLDEKLDIADDSDESDDAEMDDDEVPFPRIYEKLEPAHIVEFRMLFRIADLLRECQPWRALAEHHLIGWEDPDDREVRLISVLGAGDEVYALHIHLPPAGYRFWKQIFEGSPAPDMDASLALLHMYEVEFVDPMELEDGDLALYDAVGMTVPAEGRIGGIRFRHYHPRKYPHYLPPECANELLRILLRFFSLTQKNLSDRKLLNALRKRLPKPKGLPKTIPTFHLPPGAEDDEDKWELVDTRIPWNLAKQTAENYDPPVAEIFRIAGLPEKDETWEIGSMRMRYPVQTEDGPIIGILALIGRLEDSFLHLPHLETDWTKPYGQIVWEAFCKTVTTAGFRPKELHVASAIAERTFTPAADHGIFKLQRNPEWRVVGQPLHEISQSAPP